MGPLRAQAFWCFRNSLISKKNFATFFEGKKRGKADERKNTCFSLFPVFPCFALLLISSSDGSNSAFIKEFVVSRVTR